LDLGVSLSALKKLVQVDMHLSLAKIRNLPTSMTIKNTHIIPPNAFQLFYAKTVFHRVVAVELKPSNSAPNLVWLEFFGLFFTVAVGAR
jgi:hypothetical protein